MTTLKLSESKARQLYPTAPAEWKEVLHESFGEKFFSQKITDRVKTFDDVLAIKGLTLSQLFDGSETKDEIAYKKVKLIAEVYNEGTVLDPMNTNQYKYYPWFRITHGSGFGLSFRDYVRWFTVSCVGVRLCFKSSELAIDAGKKFIEIYADLLIK